MATNSPMNLPAASVPITLQDKWLVTDPWMTFFRQLWQRVRNLGTVGGWVNPTGAGSRATFDMNWTTAISNPPTQSEVLSVRNQLIAVQKAVGQLVIDSKTSGTLGS